MLTLTNQERAEVAAAAHERVFQSCLDGMEECDSKQLTPDEQKTGGYGGP